MSFEQSGHLPSKISKKKKKCLGKKAEMNMDSEDTGWTPPAICGKSYLVSHQLRATK